MGIPLEIAFHQLQASEFVEARVRERVTRLAKLFPRLTSCRVVLDAPHRHQRNGYGHRIRIGLRVPGDELVITREPVAGRDIENGNDLYQTLRDAFDTAERRLKEYKKARRKIGSRLGVNAQLRDSGLNP